MEDYLAVGATQRRKLTGNVFETLLISPNENETQNTDLNFRPYTVIIFIIRGRNWDSENFNNVKDQITEVENAMNKFQISFVSPEMEKYLFLI